MTLMREGVLEFFKTREQFLLVGLTGCTGSGCTTAAQALTLSFDKVQAPLPQQGTFVNSEERTANEERKYRILYDYAKGKWTQFQRIKVRDIITSFILELPFDQFSSFVGKVLKEEPHIEDKLKGLIDKYDTIHHKMSNFRELEAIYNGKESERMRESVDFYFGELNKFSNLLADCLKEISKSAFIRIYQEAGDNLRASRSPVNNKFHPSNLFSIADRINRLIKIIRAINTAQSKPTFIVIDAFRNPFEALYFRERYSAFYLIAINTPEDQRKARLHTALDFYPSQIEEIDKKEYPKKSLGYDRFTSQNIQKCIEIADIHVNNPDGVAKTDTSLLKRQLIWFTSLLMHPGLVIPTATERAMQIAYTAKLNSGCISRQVGAVVTDKDHSVKAVGWNNTPAGQVPCILRRVEDLIRLEDKAAFSNYLETQTGPKPLLLWTCGFRSK